jgi:hypothetical protein
MGQSGHGAVRPAASPDRDLEKNIQANYRGRRLLTNGETPTYLRPLTGAAVERQSAQLPVAREPLQLTSI